MIGCFITYYKNMVNLFVLRLLKKYAIYFSDSLASIYNFSDFPSLSLIKSNCTQFKYFFPYNKSTVQNCAVFHNILLNSSWYSLSVFVSILPFSLVSAGIIWINNQGDRFLCLNLIIFLFVCFCFIFFCLTF